MTVKILSSQFVISSPSYDKCPTGTKAEYAFIGRSNVGKSSLINAICDKRELAKTSAKPGRTQLINYFDVESTGEEDQRASWEKMIEQYMQKRVNLSHVFVLIDSRHTPQRLDIEFVTKLVSYKKDFSLVFTKSD
ncbi:unnamed protein product, partial [Darwinula stevensoni]